MVSRQDDHGSNVFLSDSLGLATGALGTLFLALKLGETSRIASIDKLSVGLVVLFSVPFFGKPNRSVKKAGHHMELLVSRKSSVHSFCCPE